MFRTATLIPPVLTLVVLGGTAWAHASADLPGQAPKPATPAQPAPRTLQVPAGVPLPADYVIGADDVLSIIFWRDKDMTTDAAVRPDGKITLPLVNDLDAAGLTPDQLRERVTAAASKFLEEPNVSVVVKQINSRKVFITGGVSKPGPYPLVGAMRVMQLIASAGGLNEFADKKNISIIRNQPDGRQTSLRFNYEDVLKRRNLAQNVELKPGDTVVVP